MAVMFSYNFQGAAAIHNNRMQSMFERLGWQNVGGSCYRYPRLGAQAQWPEDWFNHVIPALMCFRAYVLHNSLTVPKFSLDAMSSTGHDSASQRPIGSGPRDIGTRDLQRGGPAFFGARQLVDWLQSVTDAIPY